MDEARAKLLATALLKGAADLHTIARTAARSRQSIAGSSFYANKFHDVVVKLTRVEAALMPAIGAIEGFDPAPLRRQLEIAKSTTTSVRDRDEAQKQIRLFCETELMPRLENLGAPVNPQSEPVLTASLFAKAPTYLQRTVLQANGCYTCRWFEAASVMIRRLLEHLIIDVYEKHQKHAEITGSDGAYLMLNGLVGAILKQPHWQLQRETKKALPEIKKLGDRAAHSRRYEATRQDIDNVLSGLRAAADDLLHLAGHK